MKRRTLESVWWMQWRSIIARERQWQWQWQWQRKKRLICHQGSGSTPQMKNSSPITSRRRFLTTASALGPLERLIWTSVSHGICLVSNQPFWSSCGVLLRSQLRLWSYFCGGFFWMKVWRKWVKRSGIFSLWGTENTQLGKGLIEPLVLVTGRPRAKTKRYTRQRRLLGWRKLWFSTKEELRVVKKPTGSCMNTD